MHAKGEYCGNKGEENYESNFEIPEISWILAWATELATGMRGKRSKRHAVSQLLAVTPPISGTKLIPKANVRKQIQLSVRREFSKLALIIKSYDTLVRIVTTFNEL